jgi:ribonuclease E
MSKEIYISSTPQETRLAIVESNDLTEIYYERENEYTLAGSIYNGKVTRVLPGMQSSFVDIGLERDAFLYITDFMEEAGDSAEFEGGGEGRSSGGAAAGGARREGRGGGGERGGRGRRERGAAPATAEDATDTKVRSGSRGEEDEIAEPHREAVDGEDVGEGAPGADGSRRWRGRRGRRRGRSGEEETPRDAAATSGPSTVIESDGFEDDAPAAETRAAEPRAERSERGGRGRREGSRGGEGRSPREDRAPQEDRAPREDRGGRRDNIRERFAPRGPRSSHGEERVDLDASAEPQGEPFILPGESLSKYRGGDSAETSAPRTEVAAPAKASTEFVVQGWDGGMVLPGETIRPRGNATESRGESRPSSREDRGERGGDRRRDRDAQRGRGVRRERSLDPAEAVQPAVTSQHEVEASVLPFTDDAPAFETRETEERFEVQHTQDTAHAEFVAQRHEAQDQPEAVAPVEEFHETVAEYEPEDNASASYRVDTGETREFRQSAPVEEHDQAAPEHEFTSVQATGEMISEPVVEIEELEDDAAPMEHERAVQGVHLDESEGTPIPAQGFAPGDGELEEELLDDEDEDGLVLQGSAAFDDDTEEETLEGTADLSTMLEDMSLDALVHPDADEVDDEDEDLDFDDEDLEEDELGADEELSGSEISEREEEEFAERTDEEGLEDEAPRAEGEAAPAGERRERTGRRDRSSGRGGRERSGGNRERSGSGGDRGGNRDRRGMAGSRSGGRMSRSSAQMTDLPAISDLLKPGQEVLVQIAKEPIAKKGARITSHIALPGRFLVFMPTVSHIGVSRKIESDGERRRLKEILLSERGEASGGFIVRTAASGASEEELRSDLRFLLNLWADIKQRSESSKSPALIYHDLNLIERILRDQVTDNFSAIWVDTETEYERVLRFLQRFQPSLIRRVKLYTKETPLFEQFGLTEEINKALRSKVWLKSGGSIVINQTEALVAIDINTGKFVGKTARLEDTIVKTNLDAIPEIVRQIRLRDLGGIIVIDFIDMDERKNRHKVLAALEEELKKDRAPSKVLQFNDFGLVAITRKRVKQSLERTLSTTCNICAGTGMVKSPVTVCNDIYVELRKMHKHMEKGDVMLRVNPEVTKQLKLNGGKWLQELEEMSGKTILVKSDPSLHPEQFDLH